MPRIQANLPHSWSIDVRPPGVYPGTPSRGRYPVRVHRKDLILAGALARVGRELVILGEPYNEWLQKSVENVPNYDIAPNRSRRPAIAPLHSI
jgi:hypothetical protein